MIKNQFLLILIVMICAIIVSNIGASIYASIMLFTDIGFGIIAIGIGYLVGKVIFYVTTENMKDDQSREISIGTLKYTSIFGAIISGFGVIIGDITYYAYSLNEDGSPYEGAISYLDVFTTPFYWMADPISLFSMSFEWISLYFTSIFSGEDIMWGIMSLVFVAWAMYWSYIFSLGASYEGENEEISEVEYTE